ncbi:MAG: Spy/CpxP family protein refolding chaperone [Rhizobiales bacterium]|nr:Spy/CpxP family protein refolding chaperone [Hyphomicrobiales bacterium]
MRGRTILLIALPVTALGLQPDLADAQLSPQGILGAVTSPFRHMFGNFGRRSHSRHERAIQQDRQAAQDARASQAAQAPNQELADIGLIAWPNAFQDVLGYTFWPSTYAAQVRGRGFNLISDTITAVPRGAETARSTTTGSARSDSDVSSTQACNAAADVQVSWPVSQIEQTAQLSDAQRDALGRLRTALAESIKTMKATCRDVATLPPINRLDATVQQLWALRDAGIYVRTPLKDFYDSLTDAQKAQFEWKQPQDVSRQGARAANGAMGKQYQACASLSLGGSERLIKQIEQEVRPSKEQNESIEALRKTSGEMAKLLTASCAQPIPVDPVARLDSANDQLTAISYAATSVEIALDGFYAQLDEAQKDKFDLIGR